MRPRKENENIIARSARASCINASIRASLPPLSLIPLGPVSSRVVSRGSKRLYKQRYPQCSSYKQRISNRSALSCAYAPFASFLAFRCTRASLGECPYRERDRRSEIGSGEAASRGSSGPRFLELFRVERGTVRGCDNRTRR